MYYDPAQYGRFYPIANDGNSVPEYGLNKPRVSTIVIPLDVAFNKKEFPIGGTFLWAVNATDTAATIEVAFQDQYAGYIPYSKDAFVRAGRFSKIYITSDAQAGKTITLAYGVEDDVLGFRVEKPSVNVASVTIVKPGTLNTSADVALNNGAQTLLIAANTDRQKVTIQALDTNTVNVRVGDNGNVGAARGIFLPPGGSVTLVVTASIYGFANAAGQSVAILEEAD